ncbi:hypothetical protein [Pseudodesulfovibrio portus]|uniref:DUF4760 domain-containing protein n=1 Tax=Pseudodesulfovibrio portus TaxID=231439 RepID=A0ABN6RW59_9BACT|nr:hypothetical protein [Pseudodesulfovibrio portus]BDQ33888.1 hypothetical protein JCM14722_14300 [Pseudodesulfovibrio portus]
MDVLDMEIWVGLIVLTSLLYVLKWFLSRKRTVRVYRISPESLKRSKNVMMALLPLIEDGGQHPLDIARMPYSKEDIKSAAKILAYYFYTKKQQDELARIKYAFVAVSRFQDPTMDSETQEKRMLREHRALERELQYYMTHSPFNVKKTGRRKK